MYLYREQYVSGYNFDNAEEVSAYENILNVLGAKRCEGAPHVMVSVCVAYWRKANAIHKWFCDLDGGKDECQRISVSIEKLIELRNLCAETINQPDKASEILPTKGGFFFGSTEYDSWYIEEMKQAVSQLDDIIDSVPDDSSPWDYSFYYQASW